MTAELELFEVRVLRALRSGPLYVGALELVAGADVLPALRRLAALALVGHVGEGTWRITDAGELELERRRAEAPA